MELHKWAPPHFIAFSFSFAKAPFVFSLALGSFILFYFILFKITHIFPFSCVGAP
jgi:hypothetical protein